jgi:amino acid adenylation domain-containing protein
LLVQHFLESSARRFPAKTAVIHKGQRISYREIEQRSNRLAHALIAAGLRRGDRVAICLDNTPDTVVSIFACLKADATFLMLNPSLKVEKLLYVLNNSRASTLITFDRKLGAINECWSQSPHLRTVCITGDPSVAPPATGKMLLSLEAILLSGQLSSDPPPSSNTDQDLAALLYTSGSSGKPKGVMLTHRNICSAAESVTSYLENGPDDVILVVLPLFFGYGLYQVLMTFFSGGTVILERSMAFPHLVLEKIGLERVSGIAIVPTVAAILLQMDLTKYDFSSLRYITNAGAALPVEHTRRLRRLLPHVKLFLMYGQTECIRTSFLAPSEVDRRPDSVGKAMPNCEVFIVDDHGRELPRGSLGELVLRGPNLMRGYWEDPEATDKALRPGPIPGETFLYSGDIFRMDAEGFLYYVSRKDDIIKVGGQRVGPKEIEDVLCHIPGVVAAAVVGVPDPIMGITIKAVLELAAGSQMTAQQVMAYCSEHLEDFMVPRIVEFRESLPTTETGKVSRRALRGEQ